MSLTKTTKAFVPPRANQASRILELELAVSLKHRSMTLVRGQLPCNLIQTVSSREEKKSDSKSNR